MDIPAVKTRDVRWYSDMRRFTDWRFTWSCVFSAVVLCGTFVVNSYASAYATARASNSVSDIILSNIPAFNVDGIFIYGPIVLWVFVTVILLLHPQRIPFTIKAVSLFVLIRSAFVTLTHLGPFPSHIYVDPTNIISTFTSGNDLFFSGHTGLPFLLALIFWDNLRLRIIFIASAILFGVIVLMGHLHYSIDVAAAFFITFSIYHIAMRWFKKDLALFKE